MILLFALFACEKVIDVDLNEVHPAIVVEGNISSFPFQAEVKLSKTGSYFGESTEEKISGALVVVESDLNEYFEFAEVAPGIYKSEEISPTEGVTYNLSVEIENEIYEASSRLNSKVEIDALEYFYDEGFAFYDEGYVLKTLITDPPDTDNFYRIKTFLNDSLENEGDDFIVFDDRLFDGQEIEITLRGNMYLEEDTVTLQLISLDEGAYKYFDTFQELLNVNPGSAAPANPSSNISNGALGYFSVWSSDIRTVVIKKEE
jgi:hypothetical protein